MQKDHNANVIQSKLLALETQRIQEREDYKQYRTREMQE